MNKNRAKDGEKKAANDTNRMELSDKDLLFNDIPTHNSGKWYSTVSRVISPSSILPSMISLWRRTMATNSQCCVIRALV